MDADAIAERVDSLGLSLDTGVSWDTAHAGFTSLRSRLEPGFELLAELVRAPTFAAAEVERLRDERSGQIQQRRGTPSAAADELAQRWTYAPGTPQARPLGGLLRTVGEIDRGVVQAFHAERYRPRGSVLVAAGDASAAEIAALAERWLADWEGDAPAPGAGPVAPRLDATTLVLLDRPGAVQSELRVQHLGIPRAHGDFFAVTVMNAILGGTFTSRLNLNLRERLGYTYGASSAFPTRRESGAFSMSTAVQTEVTAAAVREMLGEMQRMREAPVTAEELDDARNYLAGVFPLALQTTDGVAARLSTLATFGLPDDYYHHYRDRLLAVTADEVRAVAERHLWPERAAVVVAGDAASVLPGLEGLGIGPVVRADPAEFEA
jgi:zinc protease